MNFFEEEDLVGNIGSAWYRHIADSAVVQRDAYIRNTTRNTLFRDFEELLKDLSYAQDPKIYDVYVSYKIADIKTIIHNDKDVFGVKLPDNVTPTKVQGVDKFFIIDGYIYFSDKLQTLFVDNYFIILEADHVRSSIYTFLIDTETAYENIDYIVEYFKNGMDKISFQQAIYSLAKLPRLPNTMKLLDKVTVGDETTYTFEDDFEFVVSYKHVELQTFETYGRDHMFLGDALNFHSNTGKKDWYKVLDWTYGLSLEPLTVYKDLIVTDSYVSAYAGGMDYDSRNGDKVHARFQMVGDYDTQEQFWEEVAVKETLTGVYLNSVIGLVNEDPINNLENLKAATPTGLDPAIQALPNKKQVQALSLVFDHFLTETAFVTTCNRDLLDNVDEIFKFINKHIPLGLVPINRVVKTVDATKVNLDYILEPNFNTIPYLEF